MLKKLSCIRYCYVTICIKFQVHRVFNIEVLMLQKNILVITYQNIQYSLLIKISKIPEKQNKFLTIS
jgi:hypothetical protein